MTCPATADPRTLMLFRDYFRRTGWLIAAILGGVLALAGYLVAHRLAPDGWLAGRVVGLWYGLLGYACFAAVAVVLAWHRRLGVRPSPEEEANAAAGRVRRGWRRLERVAARTPRSYWLQAHVWLSVLGSVLILCHAGWRLGGVVERVLMLALALTLLTGVFGVVVQSWGPRWLTGVGEEIPVGQLPTRCAELRQQADSAFDALSALVGKPAEREEDYQGLRRHFDERYPIWMLWRDPFPAFERAVLAGLAPERLAQTTEHRDALRQAWDKRREYGRRQWRHRLLHGWLYVHVPASVALLALGLWHGVVSVWY